MFGNVCWFLREVRDLTKKKANCFVREFKKKFAEFIHRLILKGINSSLGMKVFVFRGVSCINSLLHKERIKLFRGRI